MIKLKETRIHVISRADGRKEYLPQYRLLIEKVGFWQVIKGFLNGEWKEECDGYDRWYNFSSNNFINYKDVIYWKNHCEKETSCEFKFREENNSHETLLTEEYAKALIDFYVKFVAEENAKICADMIVSEEYVKYP